MPTRRERVIEAENRMASMRAIVYELGALLAQPEYDAANETMRGKLIPGSKWADLLSEVAFMKQQMQLQGDFQRESISQDVSSGKIPGVEGERDFR